MVTPILYIIFSIFPLFVLLENVSHLLEIISLSKTDLYKSICGKEIIYKV
jgi:hypothetical protein